MAIRRIFKLAFAKLFWVSLGYNELGDWPRKVRAPQRPDIGGKGKGLEILSN